MNSNAVCDETTDSDLADESLDRVRFGVCCPCGCREGSDSKTER